MVDDPRKRANRIWGLLVIRENGANTGGIAPTDGVLNGKCWFVQISPITNRTVIIFIMSPVGAMPPCSPLLREPQTIYNRKIPKNIINGFLKKNSIA